MPLDPQAKKLLDEAAAIGGPPLSKQTIEEVRQGARDQAAATSLPPEPVAGVEDRCIPGPGGDIPVRIYTPAGPGPLPALVYFHGGGWVMSDLNTHDGLCRALANRSGALIVSVDYRLAPESPFPASIEDACAATLWVWRNAASLGADPSRVAVGGDSAGGNLAAATCLWARDHGSPPIAFQLLIYPVVDRDFENALVPGKRGGLPPLPREHDLVLASVPSRGVRRPKPHGGTHPCGIPGRSAPALVLTAEFDPLRDEGEAYAARLREAGVPVTLTRYQGMIHGFVRMAGVLTGARQPWKRQAPPCDPPSRQRRLRTSAPSRAKSCRSLTREAGRGTLPCPASLPRLRRS